jgi:hypothetical protein
MSSVLIASKTRKNASSAERSANSAKEAASSRLTDTLRWLSNAQTVNNDEHIELILISWHPLILVDRFSEEANAAQKVLDKTVRDAASRSTMVCGGHRVWWLLNSNKQALKLRNLKAKIERLIRKQPADNPLFEKLDESLIVQRIGCWTGPTTMMAKGLSGIFADLAAGQTLLDNFGLPFERQHSSFPSESRTKKTKAHSDSSNSTRTSSKNKRGTASEKNVKNTSRWINNPSVPTLGQWHPVHSYQQLTFQTC